MVRAAPKRHYFASRRSRLIRIFSVFPKKAARLPRKIVATTFSASSGTLGEKVSSEALSKSFKSDAKHGVLELIQFILYPGNLNWNDSWVYRGFGKIIAVFATTDSCLGMNDSAALPSGITTEEPLQLAQVSTRTDGDSDSL